MGAPGPRETEQYYALEEAYHKFREHPETYGELFVWVVLNSPYPQVRSLAASLIFRSYHKIILPNLDLLGMLFDPLVKRLSFPSSLRKASEFTFFLRATTQGFAVFLRQHDYRNLSRIVRFFQAGLQRSIPRGSLGKAVAKIILGLQIVLEARTVIQRKGKIKLADDIGPAITYKEAKGFFKLPQAEKRGLMALLQLCDPENPLNDDSEEKLRRYALLDSGLAYNFVSGALLIQAGSDPVRFLPLLKDLFYNGNNISRYTAVRILLYLLEYAPSQLITPKVIEAATGWIVTLLASRQEEFQTPLDYSYPIAQICYILNRNAQSSTESSPEFTRWLKNSLIPLSKTCSIQDKVIIARGAKQFQHMQGRFCTDINLMLLEFPAEPDPTSPTWHYYRVLEQAFCELRITFPDRTQSFFRQIDSLQGLIQLPHSSIKVANSIRQTIDNKKIPEYPQYIGWSVNLVTFFQNILVYGGGVRTIMLKLVGKMENAPSLWSYLKYLSNWLLNPENMDRLANAAESFQSDTGFSWDSPHLLDMFENLNKDHQEHGSSHH